MSEFFDTRFAKDKLYVAPFYLNTGAKIFLERWCAVNDSSLSVKWVTRAEWQQKNGGRFIEQHAYGVQRLVLPDDLRLWELLPVIEQLDAITYRGDFEKSQESTEALKQLARILTKAGVYLAHYSSHLQRSKPFADELALSFYQFGVSMLAGERDDGRTEATVSEIAKFHLTEEDKSYLDKWFLNEQVYQTRKQRLEKKHGVPLPPSVLDAERQRIVRLYFSALTRKGHQGDVLQDLGKDIRGPFKKIQDTTEENVTRTLEAPKLELIKAIFHRGLEKMMAELRVRVPMPVTTQVEGNTMRISMGAMEKRVIDELNLPELKQNLAIARKKYEITGNANYVVYEEKNVMLRIHKLIAQLGYMAASDNPSEIVASRTTNCLGASLITSKILTELNIQHYCGIVPAHSIIILQTTDGALHWRDMLSNSSVLNRELNDRDLEPGQTMDDVKHSLKETGSARLYVQADWYKWGVMRHGAALKQYLHIVTPEKGLLSSILNNVAHRLNSESTYEAKQAGVEAAKLAIQVFDKNVNAHEMLGLLLQSGLHITTAIEAMRKAAELEPSLISTYINFGILLNRPITHVEAEKVLKWTIAVGSHTEDIHIAYDILSDIERAKQNIAAALQYQREALRRRPDNQDYKMKETTLIQQLQQLNTPSPQPQTT